MTEPERPRANWPADIALGLGAYLLTLLPVALGVALGFTPGVLAREKTDPDLATALCHFDGAYYHDIVTRGYWYDPKHSSGVAFFPGYPVLASFVIRVTGWGGRVANVVTANVALALAFVVFAAYLRARDPGTPPTARFRTLALFGLWPSGFFFRMGYSEGVLLLALALVLLGLARRWPVLVLALIAGFATGSRPVGLAATAAVASAVLFDRTRGSLRARFALAAGTGVVGCWGLLAYMGYLYAEFGNPFVFIQTQQHWAFYEPDPGDMQSKWVRLLTAEPIWNAYVPGSSRRWYRFEPHGVPVLGLQFWNPMFFTLATIAVVAGWWCGLLMRPEALLGLGLLLIPYVTRADELSMGSHARFAAVVLPAFVVGGRLLDRCPPPVTWAVFAILSPLLTVWTAMFVAEWPMV